MGIKSRANWHLGNPAPSQEEVDIEVMGTEIDLREPPEVLDAKLRSLIEREARLFKAGRWCELKMNGQSCHACSERCGDPNDVRTSVCNIGMQQEDLVRALGRDTAAEWDEIADVGRVGELVELADALAP